MNKNYLQKQKPRNRFWRLFLLVLLATLAGQGVYAQIDVKETAIPDAIVRLGDDLTFTVSIGSTTQLNNAQLEVVAPEGFEIINNGLIAGTLSSDRRTARLLVASVPPAVPRTFSVQVKALCNAVERQSMQYTLYDSDGTTVLVTTKNGSEIANFKNPILNIVYPASQQVNINQEYTRVFELEQTVTGSHINNLKVVAACDPTGFLISKVEVSKDGSVWTAVPPLTITPNASDYTYIIPKSVFAALGGYAGDHLSAGEKIYIRETVKQLACGKGQVNYSYSSGDGTNFCAPITTGGVQYSAYDFAYLPDIQNMGQTYPKPPSIDGVMRFRIDNNSVDASCTLLDMFVDVYDVWVYKRAYFVDAVGAPVLNGADTVFVALENGRYVRFNSCNDPTLAEYYEAQGLSDSNGDGVYDDLAKGKTVFFNIIYNKQLNTGACPTQLATQGTRRGILNYKNACGVNQTYERQYSTGGTTTNLWQGGLAVGPTLRNLVVTEQNVSPGTATRFSMQTYLNGNGSVSGVIGPWLISLVTDGLSDMWTTFTLPVGLELNTADPNPITINNTLIPAANYTITPGDGVSTGEIIKIKYDNTVRYLSSGTFSFALQGTGITDNSKTISIYSEYDYGKTGTVQRFSCASTIIPYVQIEPCAGLGITAFSMERTSFGYTDATKAVRITSVEDAKANGFNLKAATTNDNVTLTGKLKAVSAMTIAADDVVMLECQWGYNYMIKDPNRTTDAVLLYVNEDSTPLSIPTAGLQARTVSGKYYFNVDIAPALRDAGYASLQADDSVRVFIYARTNTSLPTIPTEFSVQMQVEKRAALGGVESCSPFMDKMTVWHNALNFAISNSGIGGILTWNEYNSQTVGIFPHGIPWATGGSNIFTGDEYRPNVDNYSPELTIEIPALMRVNSARNNLQNVIMSEETLKNPMVEGTDYTVSYADGKTFVTFLNVKGHMESASQAGLNLGVNLDYINHNGVPNVIYRSGTYTSYPTSALPVEVTMNRASLSITENGGVAPFHYTYALSAVPANVEPLTNRVEWTLRITNTSRFVASNSILPHSWIAVECPLGVVPQELRDVATGTAIPASFESYGTDKYWIKIDDVATSGGIKDYVLSCSYSICSGNPSLLVKYGMSKVDYPADPDQGYANYNSPGVLAGVVQTDISFIPPFSRFSGDLAYTPHNPSGTINYCDTIRFVGNVYNGTTAEVYNVNFRVELPDGINYDVSIPAQVIYNGATINAASAYQSGRELFIELGSGIRLDAYNGVAGGTDEARVSFLLKTACGFSNRSIVYANITGESGCGATGDSVLVSSQPVRIEGVADVPEYHISELAVNQPAYSYSASNSRNMIVQGKYTLNALFGATANNMAMIDIPDNMTLVSSSMVSSKGTSSSFTQTGTLLEAPFNNFIAAGDAGNGAFGDTYSYTIELRPDNPAMLSCDSVTVRAYSGVTTEVYCPTTGTMCTLVNPADVDRTVKTKIDQLALEFANITAAGSYGGANTEHIVIEGELKNTGSIDAGKMNIDVYYFDGVQYVPVADASLKNVQTNLILAGGTTSFTLEGNIVYPESVCQLKLVLRRDNTANSSSNAYLCYDFEVDVPTPSYNIQNTTIDNVCPMSVNTPIGESSLPRYTYEWLPATHLNNANISNPLFSYDYTNSPKPDGDELVYELTVTRPGCVSVSDYVTVNVKGLPSVQVSDRVICANSSVNISLTDPTNNTPGTSTTYAWSVETDMGVGLPLSGTSATIFAPAVTNNTADTITTIYRVTPTKDGCVGVTQTFTVKVVPVPTLPVKALPAICLGQTADLSGGVTIPSGMSVLYYDEHQNQLASGIVQPVSVGTHIFYARGTTGGSPSCATDFVPVRVTVHDVPDFTVNNPSAVCEGTSINLTGSVSGISAGSVVRYYSDALASSELSSTVVVPTVPGVIYYAQSSFTATGCKSSVKPITTSVNPLPVTGAITGTFTVCAGSSTQLSNPTGAAGGTWRSATPGIATIDAAGLVTGVSSGSAIIYYSVSTLQGCRDSVSQVITVNALPLLQNITGNSSVCVGSTTPLSNATAGTKVWSSATPGIATVDAATGIVSGISAGTATIICTITNASGCEASASFQINVRNTPVPAISGLNSVCAGSTAMTYNTEPGMEGYTWTVSGGNIVSGGNTNQVSVNWGSVAGAAGLTVNYTNGNGCTAAAATSYPVTINSLPNPTVTGPSSVCTGETGVTYTTEAGNTSYVWTVNGGTLVTGQGTRSITVNWGNGIAGEVTVNYTSGNCSAVSPAVYPVSIGSALTPGLSGALSTCINKEVSFTTDAGMSNYVWDVADGTIVSGGTSSDNTVTLRFATPGNRDITVTYTSGSCPAGVATRTVQVNNLPNPSISGSSVVCAGQTQVSYTTESSMTNYEWTVAGGTIVGGGGMMDNSVTVNWGSGTSGSVSVNYLNGGCSAVSPKVQSVTINPLPVPVITGAAEACAGAQGVQYTTAGGMSDYKWTVVGGIISGADDAEIVAINWGAAGTGTVRVNYAQNGCLAATATSQAVVVHALPAPTITGKKSVCAGEIGVTYTTQTSMTDYVWTVTGGTITGGDNTNEITVTWGAGTVGTVSVNYTDANGCTAVAQTDYPVTINALPVPTISGKNSVCADETGVVYTTEGGMSNYNWTVIGGTITGGQGSNEVTVTWTSGAAGIRVNYTNASGCSASAPTNYPVTINALPLPVIGGAASVCANAKGVSYSTAAGMSSYEWTVTGGTVISGTGTNSITVDWASGTSGEVSLNYTNANGCSAASATVYPVVINALPIPAITGPVSVCSGATGIIYETDNGMTGYTWSVTGGTITAGSSTNRITVDWGTGTGGSVKVNYTNPSGCTAVNPSESVVSISTSQTPSITGSASACVNNAVTYTTDAGMSNYQWMVDGATVTAGSLTSNSVTLIWNTTGSKNITVQYTAGSCVTNLGSKPVQVNALPNPTLTGNTDVCSGQTGVIYSTDAGMSDYLWSVTGGTITSGGGNLDNTVTVIWGAAGTGTVSVNYANTNGCTAASARELSVTVKPLPTPTITGNLLVCAGSEEQYSTESNMQGYTWSVVGGAIASGQGTRAIVVMWSNGITGSVSVNYSNNSCFASASTEQPITINALPVPGITGRNSVCAGEQGVTYTTQSGMTGYNWTVTGGTLTGGQGTDEITVSWNTGVSGTVSVNYANPAGCTAAAPATYNVTINQLPAPTISGQTVVCANTDGITYITEGGMSNYNWVVSGGAISGSTNSNSITVDWGSNASGIVSVNYQNAGGCAASSPTLQTVIINPLPLPVISGSATVCEGATGINYTTTGGMTNYQWNISGGSIVSNTGSSITVNWGSGASGTLSLSYENMSGCRPASPVIYPVTITTLPVPTISGKAAVCVNETASYTTESGMSAYEWTVSGGTIVSASNASSITVTWDAGVAGSISVNYKNANGCQAASATIFPVTVNALPVPVITGNMEVCAGETGVVYSTLAGMSNYYWEVDNGTFSGQGTESITVEWSNKPQGKVRLQYTNANGCTNSTLTESVVTINALPVFAVNSPAVICSGTDIDLSTRVSNVSSGSIVTFHDLTMTEISSLVSPVVTTDYNVQSVNGITGCVSDIKTITVEVMDKPTLDLTQSAAAICVGASYDLSAAVSNATAGSTVYYRLRGEQTASTNPYVQPAVAGIYIYDIYNTAGTLSCAGDAQTFTLTVNALPSTLLLGGDVCVGGTVQFNAHTTPADGSGVWYSSNSSVATVDNSGEVTGVSAGVFEIIYRHTGSAGCASETTSATFNVYPLPTVTVKDMTVCAGATVHVSDLVTDIHNGDKYEVYDAAIGGNLLGVSITAASTATYYVEGIMTGVNCFSAARVPVTVTVVNSPDFILTQNPVNVCNGGHINVQDLVDNVNISNYTVEVYRGDGSPVTGTVISPTNSTEVYSVRIVSNDVSTCASAYKELRVNLGSVQYVSLEDGANDYEFCVGETVVLTPDPVALTSNNITWTSSNPAIATIDNAGNVRALSGGQALITYNHTEDGCHYEGSRAILVNALPQLSDVSHFAACEGETVMFNQLASTNAGSKINFYLNGNTTAETADRVLVATSDLVYTIESENMATGCVSEPHTVTVTANAKPAFDVVPAISICQGESIDLANLVSNASAADHNLTVEDAAGNVLPSSVVAPLAQTTIYRVRMIDNVAGCTSLQQTVTVTVKDKPVLAVEDLTACVGSTVDLNSAVTSAASTLKFYRDAQAMTLVSNPSALVVVAGITTYYVQSEENGCLSDIHPITIFSETVPVFEIAGGKFTVCEGEQMVEYHAPANYYNYTWTVAGGTIANQTGNKVFVDWDAAGYGSIAVSYETSSGCGAGLPAASHAVLIQAGPDASFAIHDNTGATVSALCAGSELMLSPLAENGVWSVTPSSFAAISNNTLTALSTITTVQSITVSYTLTGSNGCTATVSEALTVNPLPNSTLAGLTTDAATVCAGATINLTAAYTGIAPWSIVYTDGTLTGTLTDIQSSVTLPVNETSTYTVVSITDGNGCINNTISSANTQAVVTLEAPAVIIAQPQSVALCNQDGENITLSVSATNAVGYQWYNAQGEIAGETAETLVLTQAEANSAYYYVEVIGRCETITSEQASIQLQLPVIEQKRNQTLWVNNNPNTNGGYNFAYYIWMKDGEEIQRGSHDKNMGVYSVDGGELTLNSIYQVMLTTTDGRTFMSCPYSYIPQNLGMSVRAYPNPIVRSAVTKVFVDVEIDDATVLDDAVIWIYSFEGKHIGTVRCEGRRVTPVELPSVMGAYLLKFVSSEIEKEFKIIVE